jgi:hypothetical protein
MSRTEKSSEQKIGMAVSKSLAYQILHRHPTRSVDAFHELQNVVRITVYDRNTDIIIVFMLLGFVSHLANLTLSDFVCGLTEYEFSPSFDDPVASTFGE